MQSIPKDSGGFKPRTPEEKLTQASARAAVMELRMFPDLPLALKKALGYGPHVDMLQHMAYWFSPRHPKMQRRWTLFKTHAEWYDECGLSRRQVGKGRKVLTEKGFIEYKRGQYGRVHYRPDWVAFAEALGLRFDRATADDSVDDSDDWLFDEDFEDDSNLHGNSGPIETLNPESNLHGTTGQSNLHGITGQSNLHGITGQSNAGEYLRRLHSGNSPLQGGAEPAFAEPAPPQKALKIEDDTELGEDFASGASSVSPHKACHEGRVSKDVTPEREHSRQPEPPSVKEIVTTLLDRETEPGHMLAAWLYFRGGPPDERLHYDIAFALSDALGNPRYPGGTWNALGPRVGEAVAVAIEELEVAEVTEEIEEIEERRAANA